MKKKSSMVQTLISNLEKKQWGSEDLRSLKTILVEASQNALESFSSLQKHNEGNIQVMDFFCGAGGTSLGFAAVNKIIPAFKILGGCDINKISAATYSLNFATP